MRDVHTDTVENDKNFANIMDELHPDWHTWDAEKKRMYAKRFNFIRLYRTHARDLRRMMLKQE